MRAIADTGVIVALLARNDPFHLWAVQAFRQHSPMLTCDAVIVEACSFFPTPLPVLTLLARGDLVMAFDFAGQIHAVRALVTKYADRPMDLADACLVRMTELHTDCCVWTVDRTDFTVYRRNHTQVVPCEFPPEF